MIKNKKYGFTVIEILIALGIISVIATMGFTFAKKGVENSYNYYVYTAYKGITDAITEANLNEVTRYVGPYRSKNNFAESGFYGKVKVLLEPPNNGFEAAQNAGWIVTSNGTRIKFDYNKDKDYVPIEVKLPSQKGVDSTLCLKYFPKSNDDGLNLNILVPTDVGTNIDGCRSTVDLLNREDLVSFYIDDGIKGRVLQEIDGSGHATNPEFKGSLEYMSAHDAICKATGNNPYSYPTGDQIWVSCSGVPGSSTQGIIKFTAPKRFLK